MRFLPLMALALGLSVAQAQVPSIGGTTTNTGSTATRMQTDGLPPPITAPAVMNGCLASSAQRRAACYTHGRRAQSGTQPVPELRACIHWQTATAVRP